MLTTTALFSQDVTPDATTTPAAASRPDPWLELPAQPIEFHIRCEAEADVLCRLLGLLAQLGLVPQRLNLEHHDSKLRLALRLSGLSQHRAGVLADKLRGLVCVWQVDWRTLASND
ncbi:hypothetical protein [Pseudomonas zhanjiangensis]|uniref:Uncharacterized protein n=1 Tax=Pseudomonas zhanjiangensis TaxID=3239015 RepID=A0ABV3YNM7_9PSED